MGQNPQQIRQRLDKMSSGEQYWNLENSVLVMS